MNKLWMTMHEPKMVTFGFVVAYAIFAHGGLSVILMHQGQLPLGVYLARMVSAWCFLIGGMIGAPTAWKGIWWAERAAVVAIGFGAFSRFLAIKAMGDYDSEQSSFAVHVWLAIIAIMLARFAWVKISPYRNGAGPLLPEMAADAARVRLEQAEDCAEGDTWIGDKA